VEPHSVDPDLSRLWSFPRAPPFSGPMPNGSFLRRASTCADTRRATRENQAPTRWRGLGDIEHERDAFRRVVREALARSSESGGGGFEPTVTQLAYPFATSSLRAGHLAVSR
jgi:hypothetical protein